jgi:hypothetical protein
VQCQSEPGDFSGLCFGAFDAFSRFVQGYDYRIGLDLEELSQELCASDAREATDVWRRITDILERYEQDVPYSVMSLETAIDYARTLIKLSVDYDRFSLSSDRVGGIPVIATISYRDGGVRFTGNGRG